MYVAAQLLWVVHVTTFKGAKGTPVARTGTATTFKIMLRLGLVRNQKEAFSGLVTLDICDLKQQPGCHNANDDDWEICLGWSNRLKTGNVNIGTIYELTFCL